MHRVWFIYCLVYYAEGAKLSCTADGAVEIIKGKRNNTVTCTEIGDASQSVKWYATQPSGPFEVGRCLADTGDKCTGKPTLGFTASRPSATLSVLTIDAQNLTSLFIGRPLKCEAKDDAICNTLDFIYPADASCSLAINTTGWTVSATCNITKVFSHAGRYSCQFFSGPNQSNQSATVRKKADYSVQNHTDQDYKTGSCGFSESRLPLNNGDVYYRALILPGYTSVVLGPLAIAEPSAPNISCSPQSAYVPENTLVQCTCTCRHLGQPAGRLLIVQRHSSDTRLIETGVWNQSSVQTTVEVNRAQHGLVLGCNVDWVKEVIGTSYTVMVANYPNKAVLTLNGKSGMLTVNESVAVSLECWSQARPTPRLALYHHDITLAVQDGGIVNKTNFMTTTRVTISTARCNHTGMYNCIANNSWDVAVQSSARLYVNCKPRKTLPTSILNLTSADKPPSLLLQFEAYPRPTTFVLKHHGMDVNTSLDKNSSALNINCSNNSAYEYVVICNVTVQHFNDTPAGFYSLHLENDFGEEEVFFFVNTNPAYNRPGDQAVEMVDRTSLITYVIIAVALAVIVGARIVTVVYLERY